MQKRQLSPFDTITSPFNTQRSNTLMIPSSKSSYNSIQGGIISKIRRRLTVQGDSETLDGGIAGDPSARGKEENEDVEDVRIVCHQCIPSFSIYIYSIAHDTLSSLYPITPAPSPPPMRSNRVLRRIQKRTRPLQPTQKEPRCPYHGRRSRNQHAHPLRPRRTRRARRWRLGSIPRPACYGDDVSS